MNRKFIRLFDPDKGGSTSGNGETPNTDTSQGETPTTTATGETPGATATLQSIEDAQKEIERLTAALKRANAEAKEHRVKASELDKLKAEAEAATLTETQKLQKQLAELQKAHESAIADA